MGRHGRLISVLALAALLPACASLPAPSRSRDEIDRMRAEISRLQQDARVREIEVRRLRAALAEGRDCSRTSQAPPPARTAPAERTPPPLESVLLPRAEAPIEGRDLDVEDLELAPGTAQPNVAADRTDTPPTTMGSSSTLSADAQALYDEAYALFHQQRYQEAEEAFERSLREYPGTRLADNAQFWIGEARYARGDVERALEAFRTTVERYPEGNKVPDALVKAGKCLEALSDVAGARSTYEEVLRAHPGTAAAAIAEERLLMLR